MIYLTRIHYKLGLTCLLLAVCSVQSKAQNPSDKTSASSTKQVSNTQNPNKGQTTMTKNSQYVQIDPMRLATTYSLEVGQASDGKKTNYFPIGFVHGDPEQRALLGANDEQDSQNNTGFVRSGLGVIPFQKTNPYGTRFYSVAWANVALASAMQNKPELETKYGKITAQLGPDGNLPKGKVRANFYQSSTQEYLMEYAKMHVNSRLASPISKTISHWGGDNEWEGTSDYSPEARSEFKDWLQKSYDGKVAGLNEAWNSQYKNFKDAAFGNLPTEAQYLDQPAKFLDFWTFQSDYFVNLLANMGKKMYETDPKRRGFMYKSTQQTIEMPTVNRLRTFNPERFADLIRPYSGGLYACDIYGSGDRQTYEVNYLYNAIRPQDKTPGYGVFLAEFNNHGGPGHQFASTAWRLLANGLKGTDLFTLGWAGAVHDWDQFGFLEAKTGKVRDKLIYASRWIHAIQRSEAFWTQAIPAAGMPRIALLMPRRDVLLAEPKTNNKWIYPENHRWMVYRWLRERGYWVDIIPATKLTTAYLKDYQGLFLIGAEHLTTDETNAVTHFVKSGGTLVADTRPAHYDEHHRVRRQLEPLIGVQIDDFGRREVFELGTLPIRGKGVVEVRPSTATVAGQWGKIKAYLNKVDKGKVLYLPMTLGSLEPFTASTMRQDVTPIGPTAESEEYVSGKGEFATSAWLSALLDKASLMPAYGQPQQENNVMGKIRVEQPMIDTKGNIAVVITNRAQSLGAKQEQIQEIIEPFTITIPLPTSKPWSTALWSAAEGETFVKVPVKMENGKFLVKIPKMATAGILYFFNNHAPLIGIDIDKTGLTATADGHGAKVNSGKPFKVTLNIHNTTGAALTGGTISLQAINGWKIEPALIPTGSLGKDGTSSYNFTVTPSKGKMSLKPDWLYPLVAHFNDGHKNISVSTMSLEANVTPENGMRLLSDNKGFPAYYPFTLETGATYSYLEPSSHQIADPMVKGAPQNSALQQGRAYNSFPGTRVAKFESKSATIIFDLKKSFEIGQVVVMREGMVLPSSLKISTSDDNINYTQVSTQEFTAEHPSSQKIETLLEAARGRYVQLQLTWPTTGAKLAQVEIWGK